MKRVKLTIKISKRRPYQTLDYHGLFFSIEDIQPSEEITEILDNIIYVELDYENDRNVKTVLRKIKSKYPENDLHEISKNHSKLINNYLRRKLCF